jgi:predicted PurR-regulated permease PerM
MPICTGINACLVGAVGTLYGAEVSSTLFSQIIFGALYGFVGVCVAVPLAFVINITRHWI